MNNTSTICFPWNLFKNENKSPVSALEALYKKSSNSGVAGTGSAILEKNGLLF